MMHDRTKVTAYNDELETHATVRRGALPYMAGWREVGEPTLDVRPYDERTVDELQELLRERDLSDEGEHDELVERLVEDDQQ